MIYSFDLKHWDSSHYYTNLINRVYIVGIIISTHGWLFIKVGVRWAHLIILMLAYVDWLVWVYSSSISRIQMATTVVLILRIIYIVGIIISTHGWLFIKVFSWITHLRLIILMLTDVDRLVWVYSLSISGIQMATTVVLILIFIYIICIIISTHGWLSIEIIIRLVHIWLIITILA